MRNRAEYMRAYRARKATPPAEPRASTKRIILTGHDSCDRRIRDLEEEVARLKRLLAERTPLVIPKAVGEGLGRSLSQTERDAILRKVQTKPDRR